MRSISALETDVVRITWPASSASPGVRFSSGTAMACCTLAGYFLYFSAASFDRYGSSISPNLRLQRLRSSHRSRRPSSRTLRPLFATSAENPSRRSRTATPASGNNLSAESDRTCGCGSARTAPSAPGRRGRWWRSCRPGTRSGNCGLSFSRIADLGVAAQKPGGDQAVVGDPIELIAGDLLGQESVVGLVLS